MLTGWTFSNSSKKQRGSAYLALLLDWHYDNVAVMVEAVNAYIHTETPPVWLSRPDGGQITVSSFVNDVMEQLERLTGGRCGNVCLNPITVAEAMHIAGFLASQVEAHPFIQECLANAPPDSVMVTLATLDHRDVNGAGVPLNRPSFGCPRAFYC